MPDADSLRDRDVVVVECDIARELTLWQYRAQRPRRPRRRRVRLPRRRRSR